MNTKALRQKILDLAIHGKLVPQDPNDEPASVLLERIKAEKERLIKEGKIKRSKQSKTACDKQHYPFELPEGWCWTTLGNIFILQAGRNITAKDIFAEQSENHFYPCFGGNGIRGYVTNCNRIGEYPIIGRQGALCGNVNLAMGEFYATEHAVVVERFSDTDLMWAYYSLIALDLNQYATATAQPGLAVNVINDVVIPIPPFQEQNRISNAVTNLFSLIDCIEQEKINLQETIKQVKSKILDLAIHGKLVPQDPTDEPACELLKRINPKAEITCDNPHYRKLPKGWAICRLSSVVNIVNGKSQKGVEISHGTYPIYGSGGIIGRANEYTCLAGSTIIGRKGTINNPIFVEENFWNVDTAFGMKATLAIEDKYFFYFCLGFDFSKLDKSTALVFLTKTAIGNIILPIPPYKEQQRIVNAINKAFTTLDAIFDNL